MLLNVIISYETIGFGHNPWRKGRNIGGYSYLCPFNFDVDFMMYSRKEIWQVTYPILLGLLAQNVINVTDTAFLGHVGEVALGASAMGGLLYICIYTVAFGFSIGSQILIARRNGEQNYRNVGPIMWQGSVFSLMMAAALLVLMYVSARPLIRVLISSDAIFEATYDLAHLGVPVRFPECDVPGVVYRHYADESLDLECRSDGSGQCFPGLCPGVR